MCGTCCRCCRSVTSRWPTTFYYDNMPWSLIFARSSQSRRLERLRVNSFFFISDAAGSSLARCQINVLFSLLAPRSSLSDQSINTSLVDGSISSRRKSEDTLYINILASTGYGVQTEVPDIDKYIIDNIKGTCIVQYKIYL